MLGDMVSLATVADMDVVGAQAVHLLVHPFDEKIAGGTQHFEFLGVNGTLEDKVTLVAILFLMFCGDHAGIIETMSINGCLTLRTCRNNVRMRG